jgi:hypothetical protein
MKTMCLIDVKIPAHSIPSSASVADIKYRYSSLFTRVILGVLRRLHVHESPMHSRCFTVHLLLECKYRDRIFQPVPGLDKI